MEEFVKSLVENMPEEKMGELCNALFEKLKSTIAEIDITQLLKKQLENKVDYILDDVIAEMDYSPMSEAMSSLIVNAIKSK